MSMNEMRGEPRPADVAAGRVADGAQTDAAETMRPATDLRTQVPVLGLVEYWYPAIKETKVSWKKPEFVRMLGEDLCLFRGKSGKVVAVANACPHRGAMLSEGNCEFRGFLSCFYHGFVFDERGECVAALGEGPQSPMPGKVRVRVYPTETHKGIVFVWMGRGKPAPIEENIPEEFFDSTKMVLYWSNIWPANWRPAFENSFDSHPRYLHRNSWIGLMNPIMPAHFPSPGRPTRIGPHRLTTAFDLNDTAPAGKRPYQDYYPGLGDVWPRRRWRLSWTWLFDLVRKAFKLFPRYKVSETWGMGQHLPGMIRIHYGPHMFTRWSVPVDENTTRMVYFHTAERRTVLGRAYEWLAFWVFHNPFLHRNFTGQDIPAAARAYYDRPENLAPTDAQVIQWRKMASTARGIKENQ
jgi:nitrite reductase/ring-hydroxylating ferredoxin subunit